VGSMPLMYPQTLTRPVFCADLNQQRFLPLL